MTTRTLTSEIVHPHATAQKIDVVHKNQNVSSLVHQKGMPRLSDISRIPEDGHAKYELRTDDSDASTDGDPGENICYAAIITLFPSHPSQHRGTNSADQTVVMGFVLTIALFHPSGASILVQWYCPPAVGYTLASSANVAVHAPTNTTMIMGPYTSVTGPPWVIARAKVAARPAQLLHMIQPADIVSMPDMLRRLVGCALGLRVLCDTCSIEPTLVVTSVRREEELVVSFSEEEREDGEDGRGHIRRSSSSPESFGDCFFSLTMLSILTRLRDTNSTGVRKKTRKRRIETQVTLKQPYPQARDINSLTPMFQSS
jgi:hypothetical protein